MDKTTRNQLSATLAKISTHMIEGSGSELTAADLTPVTKALAAIGPRLVRKVTFPDMLDPETGKRVPKSVQRDNLLSQWEFLVTESEDFSARLLSLLQESLSQAEDLAEEQGHDMGWELE